MKTVNEKAEELYSRLGERFKVTWIMQDGSKKPTYKAEDLPEGVTENDVDTVIQEMSNDGWF